MKIKSYLQAGYPLLWVQTHEEGRAMATICRESGGYACWGWDVMTGLVDHATGIAHGISVTKDGAALAKIDPGNQNVRPINNALMAIQAAALLPETSLLFLKDFHKFIKTTEVFRSIKNLLPRLKTTFRTLIVVSPVLDIPVELEKDFTLIDFELPTVSEIRKVAENILKENSKNIPIDDKAIEAGKGLTLQEAENAIARSLVETKGFDRQIITDQKLQAIKKSGLMELYEPVSEKELGGLGRLKKYLHLRLRGFSDPNIPKRARPKGILLVGLPGGGKSLSAKVVASVLGLPMLRVDVACLKGGIVGQTEENTKRLWKTLRAVSPAVVFLDEIEKAFGGVQSSNRTEGGAGAAAFGIFLTEMQEAAEAGLGIYIVATCNDIGDLLAISQGALLRRFDDVFFVDLPDIQERAQILEIMNKRYGTIFSEKWAEKMENWTGAEIEKFVSASLYEPSEEAILNVKPVYLQNQERIEQARQWAKSNARLANDNGREEKEVKEIKKERRIKL